jgi:hypothetical protein
MIEVAKEIYAGQLEGNRATKRAFALAPPSGGQGRVNNRRDRNEV